MNKVQQVLLVQQDLQANRVQLGQQDPLVQLEKWAQLVLQDQLVQLDLQANKVQLVLLVQLVHKD